jgi:hypothetical protein
MVLSSQLPQLNGMLVGILIVSNAYNFPRRKTQTNVRVVFREIGGKGVAFLHHCR